jgi:hypothetical protein
LAVLFGTGKKKKKVLKYILHYRIAYREGEKKLREIGLDWGAWVWPRVS